MGHEAVSSGGVSLRFRGLANARAILADRVDRHGLSAATDVVISGCSAGGIAASLVAEYAATLLPGAFIALLIDSSLFTDWSLPPTGQHPGEVAWRLDTQLRAMFSTAALNGVGSAVPEACLASHKAEPWRCVFLEHLLPLVADRFPTFILQSRFDPSNIRSLVDPTSVLAFGDTVETRLRRAVALVDNASFPPGFFLDSCFHHCMRWAELTIDGETPATLFASWFASVRARSRRNSNGESSKTAVSP